MPCGSTTAAAAGDGEREQPAEGEADEHVGPHDAEVLLGPPLLDPAEEKKNTS